MGKRVIDHAVLRGAVAWGQTVALVIALGAAASARAQSARGLLEPSMNFTDASLSWRDHGMGKLDDGSGNGATRNDGQLHAALDLQAQLTDSVSAVLNLDGYAARHSTAGSTEAYLRFNPVPRSAWQYRYRAGMFLPPISLENTAVGWTTPYTLTPSLLNDWVGEELRALGGEATIRHLGIQSASRSTFTLRLGVFEHNDTAGTLLAWRGWAANERVTPWGHSLPFSDSIAFHPGWPYARVAEHTDPFLEVDHHPGYYLTGGWNYLDRVHLELAHYDNRADSTAFAHGQIGWRTHFDQLGADWRAGRGIRVIGQYLRGNTLAGREDSPHSVYADFKAWFVLVSQVRGAHRVSLRYEGFGVTDRDMTSGDDNNENGHAWTLAYLYELRKNTYLGAQYMVIRSSRPERATIGLQTSIDERQLRLAFRYLF